MNSSRIAVIAATTAALAWGAKAVAIGLAGGLDRSPAENPLFFLGLALALVALVALTLSALHSRPLWQRVAGVPLALVALVAGIAAVDAAIRGLATSDHWVWAELSLWVSAAVLLGLTLRRDRRSAPGVPMHAAPSAGYASR